MKLKIILSLMLIALLSTSVYQCHHFKVENKRLSDNQTALLEDVKYFENSYGESQADVQRLLLTTDEFKQSQGNLVDEIKRLEKKLKNLESVSHTASETNIQFQTLVKDSIIYIEGKTDTIRCLDYKDTWNTLSACEKDDILTASLNIKDTLIQVVYREPKKFLCFRYGTKAIRQEIVSKNPHTHIKYSKYIEFSD